VVSVATGRVALALLLNSSNFECRTPSDCDAGTGTTVKNLPLVYLTPGSIDSSIIIKPTSLALVFAVTDGAPQLDKSSSHEIWLEVSEFSPPALSYCLTLLIIQDYHRVCSASIVKQKDHNRLMLWKIKGIWCYKTKYLFNPNI